MPETDDGARRARFEAEVTAADLRLSPEDRERLFDLWTRALPSREALRAGQIVVLDNLVAHKGERTRAAVEADGIGPPRL